MTWGKSTSFYDSLSVKGEDWTWWSPRAILAHSDYYLAQSHDIFFESPHCCMMVTASMKLKDTFPLEGKLWQCRQQIKKQRHQFANKGPYSQNYGFSSSHVQMCELDHKQGWALKNWRFRTVVLEKILQGPLDIKETTPVNPKWNQPWIFVGRNDGKAEAPIVWLPDVKS